MMKLQSKHMITAAALLAVTMAAPYAAGMAKEVSTSKMPAVITPNSYNPSAPVEGRNSFTQDQATERLAKEGYRNVKDLVKGEDGIWRGMADMKGKTHAVMLDYQGNITTGTTSSTMPK